VSVQGRAKVGGWKGVFAVAVGAFAISAIVASAAQAVVPGTNGKIFYQSGSEIYSVNPDASNPTNVTNTPSLSEQRPSVSGDGQRVAFMEYSNGWSIWKMNGNGSSPVQITNDGTTVTNFEPGISPNGNQVVFMKQNTTAQDLWMVGINGGAQTDLTNTPFPTPAANLHSDECCGEYSPDGTKIVYANGFNSDVLEPESNDIWVMNANGTNQHGLTGPHDYPIQDISPSWSPDGTKIAFARTSTEDGTDGLYVINANGTGLTPIMNGSFHVGGNDPTWSPDGTRIAFDGTGGHLYTVPPTGGAPTFLASNGDYPTWAALGDTAPPNTTITSGPPLFTKDTSPTFGFTSSEAGSTFKCRLDGAATFTSCASPKTYSGLAAGAHTFRVRATDSAFNTDPTPATRTFTVDTQPPNTAITSGPSGTITKRTAAFGFSSSEAGSHFQCKLDAAAFAACSTPKSYSGLVNGSHAFRVRAIDKAGNVDATPAVRTFNVQP
jgi:Tol biopolymer transport system component